MGTINDSDMHESKPDCWLLNEKKMCVHGFLMTLLILPWNLP
jgi:hypothetical protein